MLILIAHGSRDARWRGSLENLAACRRNPVAVRQVEVAFMQFDGPTLPEVDREGVVTEGVTDFQLLPLFMASAGHVDKDIRPLVKELGTGSPDARTGASDAGRGGRSSSRPDLRPLYTTPPQGRS